MKAISLWQPWASAVAVGAKTIETRTWWTPHRGRLAIHAAKKDTPELREFFSWKVCDPLRRAGFAQFEQLPFGAIIATCRLVECLHATDVDCLTDQERALGDYSPGRYAWVFEDIEPLEKPVPCRGFQSLFDWPQPVRRETAELF
jgi:activating signal cointegrator 1